MIEVDLGYSFKNPQLLTRAMSHASLGGDNYERMEFLGDRILSSVIAVLLYNSDQDLDQGMLSVMHNNLVRSSTLAKVGSDLGLEKLLQLSDGERIAGGSSNRNNLENAMEALIGAVYLDSDYQTVFSCINKWWAPYLDDREDIKARDGKSLLQEWGQKRGLPLPQYLVVSVTGPQHKPEFVVTVALPGLGQAEGVASSKKAAENQAADNLLIMNKLK